MASGSAAAAVAAVGPGGGVLLPNELRLLAAAETGARGGGGGGDGGDVGSLRRLAANFSVWWADRAVTELPGPMRLYPGEFRACNVALQLLHPTYRVAFVKSSASSPWERVLGEVVDDARVVDLSSAPSSAAAWKAASDATFLQGREIRTLGSTSCRQAVSTLFDCGPDRPQLLGSTIGHLLGDANATGIVFASLSSVALACLGARGAVEDAGADGDVDDAAAAAVSSASVSQGGPWAPSDDLESVRALVQRVAALPGPAISLAGNVDDDGGAERTERPPLPTQAELEVLMARVRAPAPSVAAVLQAGVAAAAVVWDERRERGDVMEAARLLRAYATTPGRCQRPPSYWRELADRLRVISLPHDEPVGDDASMTVVGSELLNRAQWRRLSELAASGAAGEGVPRGHVVLGIAARWLARVSGMPHGLLQVWLKGRPSALVSADGTRTPFPVDSGSVAFLSVDTYEELDMRGVVDDDAVATGAAGVRVAVERMGQLLGRVPNGGVDFGALAYDAGGEGAAALRAISSQRYTHLNLFTIDPLLQSTGKGSGDAPPVAAEDLFPFVKAGHVDDVAQRIFPGENLPTLGVPDSNVRLHLAFSEKLGLRLYVWHAPRFFRASTVAGWGKDMRQAFATALADLEEGAANPAMPRL